MAVKEASQLNALRKAAAKDQEQFGGELTSLLLCLYLCPCVSIFVELRFMHDWCASVTGICCRSSTA